MSLGTTGARALRINSGSGVSKEYVDTQDAATTLGNSCRLQLKNVDGVGKIVADSETLPAGWWSFSTSYIAA